MRTPNVEANLIILQQPRPDSPARSADRPTRLVVRRSRNTEALHFVKQRGALQAESGGCPFRTTEPPLVEAFARYSYQNNVPFLARNFGTFGIHLGYDLFDGGRKRSVKREREAQLAQAKENLARLTDEVELAIHTAYNKLERTEQMVKVSEEVVALRSESNRVLQQELLQGAALMSQAAMATAQEYDAKALLLQSQLDYSEAHDEFIHAMGLTPE